MTEDEIQLKLADLEKGIDEVTRGLTSRIEDLEHERLALKNIPMEVAAQVALLAGRVETLQDIVLQGFNGRKRAIEIQDSEGNPTQIRKESPIKNAIQFAAVLLVPLLVALIGLYAVTHGSPSGK